MWRRAISAAAAVCICSGLGPAFAAHQDWIGYYIALDPGPVLRLSFET
jgi:hypothetical protein